MARIFDDLQAGPSPVLHSVEELRAVGHRVVHGGERYTSAVLITAEVKRAIEEFGRVEAGKWAAGNVADAVAAATE